MGEICKLANKKKIFIIEDIAQAHLAKYKKKIVGNFGDVACISFYPSKNLGALGDGGAILTNSKKIYSRCKSLANYGAIDFRNPNHKVIGYNSRLDEIQAYFLLEKIKKLRKDTKTRQKLAKIYDNYCDALGIKHIPFKKNYENAYHIYLIVLKNRDKIKDELFKRKIFTKIHYEIPIHLQDAFKHLKYKIGDLPVTEYLSKNILSLPFYPGIEKRKIDYLFKSIKKLIN
jgi:dTDP-4-amino-4,6-dideoxygalactose transaminase